MAQRAPYEWSVATECNDVATTASEFGSKMLGPASGNANATYAGGSLQNQPRKYAIIAPDNPWYQDCANAAVAYGDAHGTPITDDIQYQLDLSTLSSQAASVVSKLANDGITTVFCGCDPIFPIYLTSRAHEQGYYPEWVVVGVALTDTDIVGQLFDQTEWAHAFGVSYAGPTLPKAATLGYAAYKSVESDEPANEVNLIYEQMYQLALGIQMAGPDLTPYTFQQGLRNYPGSVANAPNAEFGTWKFPPGHYTPQMDSTIIYWDPTKTSPYNGKQGAYVVASPRYEAGQYPTGAPPLPAGFGQ
jgi:Periplasmic binding protein